MKIKEIEKRIGITRANIRYYEDEGLIHPERNAENNYREYSEDDMKQLERIKVLRTLGVPISDIRDLQSGKYALDEVMERRLQSISEEKKNLEELKKVCETIIQRDVSYESVDEHLLGEGKEREIWKGQIEKILKEDITKEILTKKQLNGNIGVMLCWGYFLNVIIAFLFGDLILGYQGQYQIMGRAINALLISNDNGEKEVFINRLHFGIPFMVAFIICIACYIVMCFTANIKAQIVIFHISALALTPIVSGAYCIFADIFTFGKYVNIQIGGLHLAIFWLVLMLYIALLTALSGVWSRLFRKVRYVVGISLLYSAFWTLLVGVVAKMWILPFGMFIVFTSYIGINWFHTYNDINEASRYYAISQSCRIMNIAGVAFNMRGKSVGPMVFR